MSDPIRVLIADDSPTIRTFLTQILEKNGMQVVGIAVDGQSVITWYKELRPDIVFMDILMPKLDGYDALKRLKDVDPDVRVIILSSMSTKEMVDQCVAAGAINYILKPFQEEKIIEVIRKAFPS